MLVGALAGAVLLKNHISFTKTFFLSYRSFKYDAGGWLFPDELPSSARDIKYYHYIAYLDPKNGVSFVVEDEKEYQEMKDSFVSKYSKCRDSWSEVEEIEFLSDQPLTSDFVAEEEIEFVKKLMTNDESDYILWEYYDFEVDREGTDNTDGVICNDITHEIIIFECEEKHN